MRWEIRISNENKWINIIFSNLRNTVIMVKRGLYYLPDEKKKKHFKLK